MLVVCETVLIHVHVHVHVVQYNLQYTCTCICTCRSTFSHVHIHVHVHVQNLFMGCYNVHVPAASGEGPACVETGAEVGST